jgi:hypothetical protein
MRSIISCFLLFSLFLVSCKDQKKPEPVTVTPSQPSKLPAVFNQAVDSMMADYYALTEAFVKWDSVVLGDYASRMARHLDAIPFALVKDAAPADSIKGLMQQAKKDLGMLGGRAGITDKRRSFNGITENVFRLLSAVHFDAEPVYLQECKMAFNDTEPAVWMSRANEIRNPYMGLHHPDYGKGMVECGENKESLISGKVEAAKE